MTPPIQEPTPERQSAGQRWAISQLARRPPIIPTADLNMPFIAAQGFYTTDGTETPAWNTVYVDVWLNDYDQNLFLNNGLFGQVFGNYFGYDLNAAGQYDGGGEDAYGLQWFDQGPAVYSIFVKYETSDFVATAVGLELDLLLYAGGTYPAAFDFANPAGTIRFDEQFYIDPAGTTSFQVVRGLTTPYIPGGGGTGIQLGRPIISYVDPDAPAQQTWTFDFWCCRLGPCLWTQGTDFNCSTVGLNAC